jgi:hypothetical protein
MKIIASALLILSLATLATAQNIPVVTATAPYMALSVDNVVRVKDNVYTAEKNTVDTHGEASAADIVGRYLTIKTEGCRHIPGANVTAIYLRPANGGDKIIFSDGPSCTVTVVESSDKAPAVTK